MRFASLFGVLQSSALKTAIVKKNRRENFEVQKNTLKKMLLMDKKYEVLNVSNFYKEYFA